MKRYFPIVLMALASCIGTDIVNDRVDESLVISTRITAIKVGETVTYEAMYFNSVGDPEPATIQWSSADNTVIAINELGEATALRTGNTVIMATFQGLTDELEVEAGDETVEEATERKADLATTSSYPLSGTAIVRREDGKLFLDLLDDFSTTSDLPGLYVYLTNNTSNVSQAIEIGKVAKFSGSQTYEIPGNPGLFDFNFVLFYCKPFSVPVGDGKLE